MSDFAQRLGIDPVKIRAAAEAAQKEACARKVTDVLTGRAAPTKTERAKVCTRKIKTRYLDGEEQRKIKARLEHDHARILALVFRGFSVTLIATIYGVTEMCIYKRVSPLLAAIRNAKARGKAPAPAAKPGTGGSAVARPEQTPTDAASGG